MAVPLLSLLARSTNAELTDLVSLFSVTYEHNEGQLVTTGCDRISTTDRLIVSLGCLASGAGATPGECPGGHRPTASVRAF